MSAMCCAERARRDGVRPSEPALIRLPLGLRSTAHAAGGVVLFFPAQGRDTAHAGRTCLGAQQVMILRPGSRWHSVSMFGVQAVTTSAELDCACKSRIKSP